MRVDISWQSVQPDENTWNFEYWDKYVKMALEKKKKILFILDYDNNFIHQDPKAKRPFIPEDKFHYFLTYVEKVVTRYKNPSIAFEVWNEPNSSKFWKGDDETFFKLTKQTIEKIKTIDKNIIVVAGAIFGPFAHKYLKKLIQSHAVDKADAVSFHPYSIGAETLVEKILKAQKVIRELNYKGDLWITEIGFPTGGLYPFKKSLEQFPDAIIKTLTAISVSNIKGIIWYSLQDTKSLEEGKKDNNSEVHFGLAYPNYQLKDGGHAYSLFTKLIGSAQYDPSFLNRDLFKKYSINAYRFIHPNGENALIIWKNGKVKRKIRFKNSQDIVFSNHNIKTDHVEILTQKEIIISDQASVISFHSRSSAPLEFEVVQ